jgi:phosphoglycerol transferase MdoB-like AlkP superfamily enzyme
MISKTIIGSFVFYIISFLFVHYLWTGNARMTKLRPVVSLVYLELFSKPNSEGLTPEEYKKYGKAYQKLWLEIEGDSLWTFIPNKTSPLYKVPVKNINQNDAKEDSKKAPPNFIVVFLESHRALNVGFLNPKLKVSPTPFMDSLSLYSRFWSRMHTSGLPTTGALLSSHIGLPHHSHLAQATDLAHISIPSFASVLSDSGYNTHYFSAADPAWDNLGVWMSKWYQSQHYHRNREDDSTFFKHASSYIKDTLALNKAPFLVTLMTRSNHYPFNFAAGMSSEDKKKPLIERINITMNYTDRQLARFIRSIQNEAWFQNTYLIVLADHGFPLGENGVSTMNGGAFSNATWIPFLIYGEGLEKGEDSRSASQIDIAPTILDLAGISVENFFMGHSLIQNNNGSLSLGAYSNSAAIGYQGYRLITPYPWNQNSHSWLFREEDIYQTQDLSKEKPQIVDKLRATLDTLIRLSDHLLEKGLP